MPRRRIPDVVIRRLPLYLRILDDLDHTETPIISSQELGDRSGTTPGQVRKDLSFFGVFGKQGVGYNTENLREELRKILRLHQQVAVGLVGVGNLGTALIRYNVAREKRYPEGTGLKLVAAFDKDEKKVGRKISGIEVFSLINLPELVKALKLSVIILTVPAEAAPGVLNHCIQAGVKAFLNFAPTKLIAPPDVRIHHSDVMLELESLAYFR